MIQPDRYLVTLISSVFHCCEPTLLVNHGDFFRFSGGQAQLKHSMKPISLCGMHAFHISHQASHLQSSFGLLYFILPQCL